MALAALPPLTFWLCVIGITYLDNAASWLLLILALIITVATTTISNARIRHKHEYVFGYSGPIDINSPSSKTPAHHFHQDRIEPTLAANQSAENTVQKNNASHFDKMTKPKPSSTGQIPGWEHAIGQWFVENKKISLLFALLITATVIILVLLSLFDDNSTVAEPQPEQKIITEAAKERRNKIEMPDSFGVMLDEYDALTIGWQGDLTSDSKIWSAITAQGDQDCVEIKFSVRDEYRTMKVQVKNQGDYYADFSPVEPPKIIQSIALRDKFTLCGYEFSLKGTQAKLMNNKKYSGYFD